MFGKKKKQLNDEQVHTSERKVKKEKPPKQSKAPKPKKESKWRGRKKQNIQPPTQDSTLKPPSFFLGSEESTQEKTQGFQSNVSQQEQIKPQMPLFFDSIEGEEEEDVSSLKGINIQPIDVQNSKPKKKGLKLLTTGVSMLILTVILLVVLVNVNKQKQESTTDITEIPPAEIPEESEESDVSGDTQQDGTEKFDPSEISYGDEGSLDDLEPSNSEDNTGDVEQQEDKNTEELSTDKPTKESSYQLPEDYIFYENGYLNLNIAIPKDWYVTERTQDGFEEIRKFLKNGVFNLKEAKITQPIPIADFESSDTGNIATINVVLYPSSHQAVTGNKPYTETLPNYIKVLNTGTPESKQVGDNKTTTLTYKIDDYGLIKVNTQATVKVGSNTLFFLVSAEETEMYKENVVILEEMIKSISLK